MDYTKPKRPKPQRTTVFDPHHFVAGHLSGMMAIVASMPMDVLKTRAQIEPDSLYNIARRTVSNEGIRGLYKGMTSPLIGYGFVSAIWFGVNFNVLSYLQPERETKISFKNGMIAGGCAGLAGTFVISPMERLKVYAQCSAPGRGGVHALCDLVRSQGVIDGLFRGFHVTAAREVSQVSVHFSSYFLINNIVVDQCCDGRKPLWLPLVSGAVAGCLSWVFTMPLDIVKTKLTSRKRNDGQSATRVLCDLFREGGIKRLWAGTGAAFLRCIPLHATLFFMYDNTYEFLRRRF